MSWFTTQNPAAAPDRLDDYRALDIVARAGMDTLLQTRHDASEEEKALAVKAADEAFHAAIRRHPRVLALAVAR